MKKIGLFGLLLFVINAADAGILESRAQKSYDEVASCLKSMRKPNLCLEQLKRYAETSASVIKARGPSATTEKERLVKTLNLFANSADKYSEKAKQKANDKLANKAIAIYETVAAIQKSRRAEMLAKIDDMKGIANNRSLVLKLESRVEKAIAKLKTGKAIPYEEISPVILSFSSQSSSLPPQLLNQSVEFSSSVNNWLTRFLKENAGDIFNIDLAELKNRLTIYQQSRSLPEVQAPIDDFIAQWQTQSVANINRRSTEMYQFIAAAKTTSNRVVPVGNIDVIDQSQIDEQLINHRKMKDDFYNLNRLLSEEQARWEQLQSGFSLDKNIAFDTATFDHIGSLAKLYNDLKTGNIIGGAQYLAELDSTQWITAQSIVDFYKSGSDLIIKQTLDSYSDDVTKQADYLISIIDKMANQVVIGVVKGRLFPLIDGYLKDQNAFLLNFDDIGKLLVASSGFYPSLSRYNVAIENTVRTAISIQGIEILYDHGGFDKVIDSINAGTELLLALSSENSAGLMDTRWNALTSADINEITIIDRYYDTLTEKITRSSFKYSERDMEKTVEYMNKAADYSGDEDVRVSARFIEKSFERALDEMSFPITSEAIKSKYPIKDLKVCLFDNHLNQEISIYDMSDNLGLVNKYNYVYASMAEKSFKSDGFGKEMAFLSEVTSGLEMPDTGITGTDWDRYQTDNLRSINKLCLSGYNLDSI